MLWTRRLFSLFHTTPARLPRPRAKYRPRLEELEERCLLTQTVTNDFDSGTGSLRAALAAAAPGELVNFAQTLSGITGQTIALATPLTLTQNVVISAAGVTPVTILNGGGQAFIVNSGVTATIDTLSITQCNISAAAMSGGAINNAGTLLLSNSGVSGSSAPTGGGITNTGTLTLQNSQITGNTASVAGFGVRGGGIYSNGTLKAYNSIISGNRAYLGGGLYVYGGTASLTNTTIQGNVVSGLGGGLIIGSFHNNPATVNMINCTVSGNSAVGTRAATGVGGGIQAIAGQLTAQNSTISGNTASLSVANLPGGTGGGIFSSGSIGSSIFNIVLKYCTVTNNRATSYAANAAVFGGGIDAGGYLRLQGCTVSGNMALAPAGVLAAGGGIYTNFPQQLILQNTLVAGNSAVSAGQSRGGGITASTMTAANSTITGNRTQGASQSSGGAGLYLNLQRSATVTNCTIANNADSTGGGGGGLFVTTSFPTFYHLLLNNTIIASNTTTSAGGQNDIVGTVDSNSASNLIGNGTGSSGISNGSNGNLVGSAASPINPLLGPLQNNGGLTMTLALLPGSPALGAGNVSFVTNPPFIGPPFTDQRGPGFSRIINNAVDIGAYEVQVPDTTTALASSVNPATAGQSVTFTATVTVAAAGAAPAQGNVTFFVDGVAQTTVALTSGTAVFTTATLSVGVHTVRAVYGGVNQGSFVSNASSNSIREVINGAGFPTTYFAIGSDAGASTVSIYDSHGSLLGQFNPFAGTGFTGGLRVAIGDVTGDAIPDLVVGSGPGGVTVVLVYDGKALLANPSNPTPIRAFNPFGTGFSGGAFVAVGNLDGGGVNEIVVGADAGGGPQVNIYSAAQIQNNQLSTPAVAFFAYPFSNGVFFTGGVRVALADLDGDGKADLITTPGPGGGPQVNIYLGAAAPGFIQGAGQAFPKPFLSFFAFGSALASFSGGVYVTALDINGDGKADLLFGAGPGGGPEVTLYSGAQLLGTTPNLNALATFFALSPSSFSGGVRLGSTLGFTSGNKFGPILLAAAGPGGGPQVDEFDALAIFSNPTKQPNPPTIFNVPPATFTGGLFASVT
jgi:hypothetical protein